MQNIKFRYCMLKNKNHTANKVGTTCSKRRDDPSCKGY